MDDKQEFLIGAAKGGSQAAVLGGIGIGAVACFTGNVFLVVIAAVAIISGALGLVVWESWYGK